MQHQMATEHAGSSFFGCATVSGRTKREAMAARSGVDSRWLWRQHSGQQYAHGQVRHPTGRQQFVEFPMPQVVVARIVLLLRERIHERAVPQFKAKVVVAFLLVQESTHELVLEQIAFLLEAQIEEIVDVLFPLSKGGELPKRRLVEVAGVQKRFDADGPQLSA